MARHFSQNITLVTNYLAATTSSSSGATVEDIMAAAGISRATVYRVIKAHPAIKPLPVIGKQAKYFLDPQALIEATMTSGVGERKVKRPLIISDELAHYYENISPLEFLKTLDKMLTTEKGPKGKEVSWIIYFAKFLAEAYNESQGIQDQKDSAKPETAQNARKAIDELLVFSAIMQIYFNKMRRHPAYKSDEEFWTLFIKDNL